MPTPFSPFLSRSDRDSLRDQRQAQLVDPAQLKATLKQMQDMQEENKKLQAFLAEFKADTEKVRRAGSLSLAFSPSPRPLPTVLPPPAIKISLRAFAYFLTLSHPSGSCCYPRQISKLERENQELRSVTRVLEQELTEIKAATRPLVSSGAELEVRSGAGTRLRGRGCITLVYGAEHAGKHLLLQVHEGRWGPGWGALHGRGPARSGPGGGKRDGRGSRHVRKEEYTCGTQCRTDPRNALSLRRCRASSPPSTCPRWPAAPAATTTGWASVPRPWTGTWVSHVPVAPRLVSTPLLYTWSHT